MFVAVVPFVAIGVLSLCIMSTRGIPDREWLVPAVLIFILSIFCRSERVFEAVWWTFFLVSLALCVNVLAIVQVGDYTRRFYLEINFAEARKSSMMHGAREAISKKLPNEVIREDSPVAMILKDDSYNHCKVPVIAPEWHSPITGLYSITIRMSSFGAPRVKRRKAPKSSSFGSNPIATL
jgi:hypothetical protein